MTSIRAMDSFVSQLLVWVDRVKLDAVIPNMNRLSRASKETANGHPGHNGVFTTCYEFEHFFKAEFAHLDLYKGRFFWNIHLFPPWNDMDVFYGIVLAISMRYQVRLK